MHGDNKSSSEANKAPEFGITFSPKKFTPSSHQNQEKSPLKTNTSFNKYTPMLNKERNPDSGLNKVHRSVSMSAYERNLKKASVPEPSISYNRPNRTLSDTSCNLTGLNRVGGGSNSLTGLNRVGTNSSTGLNKTGSNLTGLKSVNEEVSRDIFFFSLVFIKMLLCA